MLFFLYFFILRIKSVPNKQKLVKKWYSLSFSISGIHNSSRSFQTTLFKNPGGVPWTWHIYIHTEQRSNVIVDHTREYVTIMVNYQIFISLAGSLKINRNYLFPHIFGQIVFRFYQLILIELKRLKKVLSSPQNLHIDSNWILHWTYWTLSLRWDRELIMSGKPCLCWPQIWQRRQY